MPGCQDKMRRQEAFTLIELLIVMSIILTFVGVAAVDFRGSKQSQEAVQMVEEVRALLQQSRARVSAGQTVEDAFACEGAYFEIGSRPQHVLMPVVAGSSECDLGAALLEDYGMQQGDPSVSFVSTALPLYLLYVPPRAELKVYTESGAQEADVQIHFANEAGEDRFVLETQLLENHFSISDFSNEE